MSTKSHDHSQITLTYVDAGGNRYDSDARYASAAEAASATPPYFALVSSDDYRYLDGCDALGDIEDAAIAHGGA